ncbi:MAG: aspartyl protease family protein [Cyanobacteria bacterium SZAS TMP-1]|nr:aspartyl protease family protein [Cyanobacteria bacterium SZAS TMP-1]
MGCKFQAIGNAVGLGVDSVIMGLKKSAILLLGCSIFLSSFSAARAGDYEDAMAQFKARDYAGAAASFRKAIFDRPGDGNCFYYYALSLHYAHDLSGAKAAYQEVVQRYPNTEAAARSRQAIASLSGVAAVPSGGVRQQAAPSAGGGHSAAANVVRTVAPSSASSSSGDIIPPSSVVNFNMENSHMVVDVAFNGRRTRAIFDTGAEMILMGKNHLRDLGLPLPTGDTIARSRGVGGKIEDVWGQRMDVTVGGVTRRNVMVHIQEQMDTLPLLGLPFVQGMNYAVDNGSLRFTARNTSTTASSAGRSSDYRTVPYVMQGRSMIVSVLVNGRPVNMCFDTGASGTLFSKAQADAAGIKVPDDAEVMIGSGVGGGSVGRYVMVNSLKLGPVEKRDIKIGVDLTSQLQNPLLGKDFWGDHRYAVDQDSHVIRFE